VGIGKILNTKGTKVGTKGTKDFSSLPIDINIMKNTNRYFWIIVIMALIATSLSFLDRQVLSILIIKIKNEITISNVQYGFINTGFLIGYAIMFTAGGILIDRHGSRFGLAVSVGLWSFATALHSLANSVIYFGFFRFLLGVGEGGAFPGAIKAVIEWVPKKKQALANGIAIGGAALGAVIAPPLCVYLINITGWRGVFIITGMIGFAWVGVWLLVTRRKDNKPESLMRKGIINRDENIPETTDRKKVDFIKLFKTKEIWVFIFIRFLLDPILYFYMFWIPKYLNETHSVNIEQIGKLFWIPFLAMGISNMLGGWISDAIFSKTGNLNLARKIIMGTAAVLMFPVLFVRFAPSPESVILIMSIAFFAHGLWITNYITSISDTFGRTVTATVVGLSGTAGAVSAFIINPVIGLIITRFSYNPMWVYAGSMYLVSFIGFILLIPKIKLLKAYT
jgi:ACS family hexuronate transporter-like MFS transporter